MNENLMEIVCLRTDLPVVELRLFEDYGIVWDLKPNSFGGKDCWTNCISWEKNLTLGLTTGLLFLHYFGENNLCKMGNTFVVRHRNGEREQSIAS